jgi:hypothetical protein
VTTSSQDDVVESTRRVQMANAGEGVVVSAGTSGISQGIADVGLSA